MNQYNSVLKPDEKAVFALRQLYGKFGYKQYKMSKFEEYDFYARNKDFLVSDRIISFTDTNGKLMALKPDVTLSIIKNTKETNGCVNKVYYNENVYRVNKGAHGFKEIMQTGLECLGDIGEYNVYEVLMLACESLLSITDDCVLDISHLGILSDLIDNIGIQNESKAKILKCASEKNVHEILNVCAEQNISQEYVDILKRIVSVYGDADSVFPVLDTIPDDLVKNEKITELKLLVETLSKNGYGKMIRIDFSVINDMNYYNGIVFKGFINNIPNGVLSGGQYDKLMAKMGKKTRAIGFAVYLDMLERFEKTANEYDVDTVILYNESDDISILNDTVKMLTDNGKSVMAQKCVPDDIKYKQLLKLKDKGVIILETHA